MRHGIVLAEQISARFFTGPAPANRRLRALEGAGLLVRDPVLTALPAVVRATPRGVRLAGCDLAPASLDLARVHHNLALVDLSEELLAAHPGSAWTTERELRRDRMRAARTGGTWERQRRVPDGLLRLDRGTRVAVELDLTPKRSARLELLAGAYAVDRDVDTVWWYLPSQVAISRLGALVAERGSGAPDRAPRLAEPSQLLIPQRPIAPSAQSEKAIPVVVRSPLSRSDRRP